jgi:transposase
MGAADGRQSQLFYSFNLEERIPDRHLLRRLNPIVTGVLDELREKLRPFYSEIGRPSIDPELMLLQHRGAKTISPSLAGT